MPDNLNLCVSNEILPIRMCRPNYKNKRMPIASSESC